MADVSSFRGFRYDLGKVGPLSEVVAPPYDVIDAELQQQLLARNPHNVVRLELHPEQASDNERDNRYTRASRLLRAWQSEDVLVQDSARSLYVCHQEFEVDGQRFIRRGFLARVRLEPFGQGRIYAHEETMAGPKADRLRLLQATGMNLSPVFGLYPDETEEIQGLLDRAVARSLPLEATDHLGTVSRLWPITDQHVQSQVSALMTPRPIFIADGHHRYETALRYQSECQQAGELATPDAPANFILMMLVGMSDPGLIIQPTHRLVSGLPGLTAQELARRLSPHFDLHALGQGRQGAADTWDMIATEETPGLLGLGTVADGAWHIARLRSPERMAQLASEHSLAWRDLAVSLFHVGVLDSLLRDYRPEPAVCRYVHLLREVQDDFRPGGCDLAALIPAARMEQVAEIAGNREKMPPKSTYFFPKILSGLVFHSVKTQ